MSARVRKKLCCLWGLACGGCRGSGGRRTPGSPGPPVCRVGQRLRHNDPGVGCAAVFRREQHAGQGRKCVRKACLLPPAAGPGVCGATTYAPEGFHYVDWLKGIVEDSCDWPSCPLPGTGAVDTDATSPALTDDDQVFWRALLSPAAAQSSRATC